MSYSDTPPTREQVDAFEGPTVLEFGVDWCPHCVRAQPAITAAMARHPAVRHLKIEDGKGRRLGRSYRVKLWPTLIFLVDGKEMARRVRPTESESLLDALDEIDH